VYVILRRNWVPWKGQMKVIKRVAIYRPPLMYGFIISQLYWADLSVSIEMDRVKMGYVGVDSINVAQDRNQQRTFLNTIMNLCIL
jgi:hypothetical protein